MKRSSAQLAGLLLLALCLGVTGCAANHPDHYTVRLDPGFSPDQQGEVLEAVFGWNAAVGTEVLTPTIARCILDELTPGTICVMPEPGTPAGGEVEGQGGCTGDGIGLVYLFPDAIAGSLAQAAAHELGHAMGVGHLSAGNVMCATSSCAAAAPEAGDAAAWKALR